MTDAHDAAQTHHYTLHYPAHPARTDDPHYVDFSHFHRIHGPDARCDFAVRGTLPDDAVPVRQTDKPHRLIGPAEARMGCDVEAALELHHAHVEFSLQNGVDLALLEHDYPGISDPTQVGAWVESEPNFEWLCVAHHRGHGGVHVAAAADYEAQHYVRGLIS